MVCCKRYCCPILFDKIDSEAADKTIDKVIDKFGSYKCQKNQIFNGRTEKALPDIEKPKKCWKIKRNRIIMEER